MKDILIRNTRLSPIGGIRLAGLALEGKGVTSPNRILNRYSLVYVLRGNGRYTDERGYDLPISAGDVIEVQSDIRHWYGPEKGQSWDEIYIIFEGSIFDLMKQKGCLTLASPVTKLEPIEYWRGQFMKTFISRDDDNLDIAYDEVIKAQQLVFEVHRAARKHIKLDTSWLNEAKIAIETIDNIQEVAESMKMPYETFRKQFKKSYGLAPRQYRILLRMDKAREMLSTSELPIKQIARQLDYCDEFHFSRQFNKTIGCSPTMYRARTFMKDH